MDFLRRFMLCALLACLLAVPATAANGLVTVKDHGAVGNGTTDDSNAFDAAFVASKTVYVPAGRYRLTRTITVPAGGRLKGTGTLYIDWDGGPTSYSQYALVMGGDDVQIEGVRIEKNTIDGSYQTGIFANSRNKLTIRNVEILNFSARYGIHIVESSNVEVSECYIHDMMVNNGADTIQDSPAGIRITRCIRGVLSGNILERIECGPINRAATSPLVPAYGPQGYQSDHITLMQSRYFTVTGNTMLTSGEGIDMLLTESSTVSGNIINDIWFQGIKMLGTAFCTVNNNKISDCYQGIGLYDGAMSTRSHGNTVVANVIRDTGSPGSFGIPGASRISFSSTYGIAVGDNSDYNQVTENVVLDTQTVKTMEAAGILAGGGPNNRIAENQISSGLTYISQTPF